jgi:hypothetical protein
LTESDLRRIITTSVKQIMNEDVLGNDWNVNDENEINNNYEPFETQEDDESHDFGIVGDNGIDNTVYS